MEQLQLPVFYLSLPHDLSGSISKNRFRLELLWGVSKMLDLMEEDQDFTMVFDYVCDIEVHYEDKFEFYQIKTHKGNNPFTTKKLTTIEGNNSILGKLYALFDSNHKESVKLAIVSNSLYNKMPKDKLINCFLNLPEHEKEIIIKSIKDELNIAEVDLSCVFFIHSEMDLEHPDDAIRGKLIAEFEKIKNCEPKKPNALYRLIVDTIKDKACYEFTSDDYQEIVKFKGLSRRQFDALLEQHAENSETGIQEATDFIDTLPDVNDRRNYKKALPNVLKMISRSKPIGILEKEMATFLDENKVGETGNAINLLITQFNNQFFVEFSQAEKWVFCLVVIKKFENGAYDYENGF